MIKVFIGTEERQFVSTAVLKHSILRRTKEDVQFIEMKNLITNLNIKMYTGFSFYRFLIPGLSEFKGRSIYSDTDVIFLDDISKLNNLPMIKPALARRRTDKTFYTSMMLLNCEKLQHWNGLYKIANQGKDRYSEIMWGQGFINKDFGDLPKEWNSLDTMGPETKALHFTNVPTQPWTHPRHKFKNVWLRELKSALEAKFITEADVQSNIKFLYKTIMEDCYAA